MPPFTEILNLPGQIPPVIRWLSLVAMGLTAAGVIIHKLRTAAKIARQKAKTLATFISRANDFFEHYETNHAMLSSLTAEFKPNHGNSLHDRLIAMGNAADEAIECAKRCEKSVDIIREIVVKLPCFVTKEPCPGCKQ
jgi:hypothetical protein